MSSSKNKAGGKTLKQGNLFSFFSKKPASTNKKPPTAAIAKSLSATTKDAPALSSSSAAAAKPVNVSQSQSTDTSKDTSGSTNDLWKSITPGCRVSVYWKEDDEYYNATVIKQQGGSSSSRFQLKYDDGETENVDMSVETFKFLKNSNGKRHRRTIQPSDDEDDEENEWMEEEEASSDDDDGSVFEAPKDGDDDDDDEEEADNWLVDDDDDDEEEEYSSPSKKKRKTITKKKTLKVTHHSSSVPTTTTTTTTSFKTPLRQFANTVSPSTNSSRKSSSTSTTTQASSLIASTKKTTFPPAPRRLHSGTSTNDNNTSSFSITNNSGEESIPMFVKQAINPKGSHIHNHLKFLRNPRDSKGRRMDDQGYDGRTLKVDHREWERLDGKSMTNAVQQWWDLKSRYFDTVLLFKTGKCEPKLGKKSAATPNLTHNTSLLLLLVLLLGKFYEMFHMDADVGVEVCNFIYMKGHVAHSGFPEVSYGKIADQLVRAGYKVARVEQTETPDQLKIRKQRTTSGKKPQVVNREVCSILTLGTRTFCCLDDPDALAESETNGSKVGPLLSIREVLSNDGMETDDNDDGDVDQVKPVCEYGVTLVDAVNGTVTIGQFADDVLRSRMNTLLAAFTPSEILVQAGDDAGASPTLLSLIKSYQTNSRNATRLETVLCTESFPKSTALDKTHRRLMERKTSSVHPWSVEETMEELHRRGYYPRGSKEDKKNISRWPKVLQAAVEGNADLCLSSLGAALFYLQRNLIDQEILGMVSFYDISWFCLFLTRTQLVFCKYSLPRINRALSRLTFHQNLRVSVVARMLNQCLD